VSLGLWALVACGALRPAPVSGPGAADPAPTGGAEITAHVSRGHYLSAVYAWEGGDCEVALVRFERARLFDGVSPRLAREHGLALLDCGAPQAGLASLRAAAQGADSAAHGHLVEQLHGAGELDQARDQVLAWAALDVPSEHLTWRGRWQVRTGLAEGGLADLARGLPLTPHDTEGVRAMLDAAVSLQRLQTAFSVLDAVHGLGPTDRQVLRWLADLAAEIGDDATALSATRRLDALTGGQRQDVARDLARLALRTDDRALAAAVLPRVRGDMGLAPELLALIHGPAEGLALLDALAQAAPLDRGLALRRIDLLAQADVDGALAAAAQVPGLAPEALARIQARTLALADRHDQALAALDPFQDHQAAARMRVRLLLDLGRHADALAAADAALARWPADPLLPGRRLLAVEATGSADQARLAASQLLALDPRDIDGALVFARTSPDRPDQVQGHLWTAIEAHPGEPELWLELARSRWVEGSEDTARAAARRAGQLLGRDSAPGERYARMCAELPCDPEERR